MAIRVLPETFEYVSFDSAYTARIAERIAALLDMTDVDVTIDVFESSPLTRLDVEVSPGAVTIKPHSGAMEDTRLPQQQSELATTVTIARGLLKARDRLRGGFSDAPADSELSLPQVAAWDAYIMGRISRLDIKVIEQAWKYNFRNRHGFNDAVDRVFDRIWSSDQLDWSTLDALSRNALGDAA